jgi:hypothetical protein
VGSTPAGRAKIFKLVRAFLFNFIIYIVMKKSRREKRKQRIEDKIFRTKSQNSVLNNDQILEQKAVRKTPNSKQHNNPFLYSFFCFLFAIIFYFIPVMAINHFVFLVLMVIAAYFVFVAKSELMSR